MKYFTLIFVFVFSLNQSTVQIINGDFDHWEIVPIFAELYYNPVGWQTNNDSHISGAAITPVEKVADNGGFYAKIESKFLTEDAFEKGILYQWSIKCFIFIKMRQYI